MSKKNTYYLLMMLIISEVLFAQQVKTVNDILEIALQQNLQLKVQSQQIKTFAAEKLLDVSFDNPTFIIEHNEISKGRAREKEVGLSQGFDFPIVYYYKHKMWNTRIKIAKKEMELLQANILLDVYFQALEYLILQKQEDFFQKNLNILIKVNKQNQKRYQAGEIPKLTVLKSQVGSRAIANDLKNLRLKKLNIIQQLQVLLNISEPIIPTGKVSADTGLSYKKVRELFFAAHPQQLLKNLKLRVLNYEKKLSGSSFLPSFNIMVKDQKIDKKNFWGGEIELSIPLWFGRQLGKVSYAKEKYRKGQIEQELIQDRIDMKFENYWSEYLQSKNNVSLYLKQILPEAREILSSAEVSYQEGAASYLEFADAYRIKLEAERHYVEVLFELNKAVARLHKYQLLLYLRKP